MESPGPAPKFGAGLCGANSFTAQTLVQMADGTWRPIEFVQEGDWVWAMDPETNETGPRQVVGLIQGTGWKDLVTFTIDGDTLTATSGHPFWVIGRGWVDAGDVNAGDTLLQADGGLEVVDAVHEYQLVTTVYNFEVQGLHTYFVEVDGEGVLVHNCAARLPPAKVAMTGKYADGPHGRLREASDGTWWSEDATGHGGSAWKVYQKKGRGLEWKFDADEAGNAIEGKHKSSTGTFIPNSELRYRE